MRDHIAQLADRRAGQREQTVIDTHDRLADEMEPVAQEQVVRLVDAARLRVVHRHEAPTSASDLHCLEHLADRRQRPAFRVGQERERAFLRERTRLTLIRSDIHARELTSGRHPRGIASPARQGSRLVVSTKTACCGAEIATTPAASARTTCDGRTSPSPASFQIAR